MKSRNTKSGDQPKPAKLIICILLLILFPFIAEIIFGAFQSNKKNDVFTPHPFLLWKFAPDVTDKDLKVGNYSCRIDTNSDGFRNEKVDYRRNERSFRILCIGDETTLGLGVKQSETWTKILQNIIRTRFHFFITEVINAGGVGYSSLQGVEMMKEYCEKYKPEIVVVSFLHNDYSLETKPDAERIPQSPTQRKTAKFLYNSKIFLYLRSCLFDKLEPSGRVSAEYMVTPRVSPAQFRTNLEQIASIARINGAVVIFVNLQTRLSDKEPAIYRRIVKDIADKSGLYLDINPDFVKNRHLYQPGGILPNEEGQKLIAGRLFELISYSNLMPRQKNMSPGEVNPISTTRREIAPSEEKQSANPEGKKPESVEGKHREKGIEQKSVSPEKSGNPPGSDDFYF
jgi:lysophospholipase L1-like esterase